MISLNSTGLELHSGIAELPPKIYKSGQKESQRRETLAPVKFSVFQKFCFYETKLPVSEKFTNWESQLRGEKNFHIQNEPGKTPVIFFLI